MWQTKIRGLCGINVGTDIPRFPALFLYLQKKEKEKPRLFFMIQNIYAGSTVKCVDSHPKLMIATINLGWSCVWVDLEILIFWSRLCFQMHQSWQNFLLAWKDKPHFSCSSSPWKEMGDLGLGGFFFLKVKILI